MSADDSAKPDVIVDAGKDEKSGMKQGLKRELNSFDLVVLGVGGIVGAGIFVVSGEAAYKYAGPAVVLSFLLAGVCSSVYALCFAELAAMMPQSGTGFTYARAAFGNFVGFIVGWSLLAEYLFCVAAVAVGWSGYFSAMLDSLGFPLPTAIANAPFDFDEITQRIIMVEGRYIDLPACLLVIAVGALLCVGVKNSAVITAALVTIKIVVITLFVGVGIWYIKSENLTPFIPEEDPSRGFGHFGWTGIIRGASVVFFAYIGFDGVTAAAAETKDPATMMPIGILSSLAISTAVYMGVSFVLVGLVPYTMLGVADPMIVALKAAGPDLAFLVPLITFAVVCGLPGVVLVSMYASSRLVLFMAQEGMLPPAFAEVNEVFSTPHLATIVGGCVSSLIAALFPISVLAELASMGTLLAFSIVCGGVIMLRHTRPELPRPFMVPFSPFVPSLGVLLAIVQIGFLPWTAWVRMVVWLLLGVVVWFLYGSRVPELDDSVGGGVYERVD